VEITIPLKSSLDISRIEIKNFKKISSIKIDISPITALVGGNTSGKSSLIQAIQLATSIFQASGQDNALPHRIKFSKTLSDNDVGFRPTDRIIDLKNGKSATQNEGFDIIIYSNIHSDARVHDTESKIDTLKSITEKDQAVKLNVKRGKNANISIHVDVQNGFLKKNIIQRSKPLTFLSPGLSGIPLKEEWRTRAVIDFGAMHGDANLYLRSILDHLFKDDLSANEVKNQLYKWRSGCSISELTDSSWKVFSFLMDSCYPGIRIYVDHDPQVSRHVNITVNYSDNEQPLELSATGILQITQILAYSCYYKPPLLLLDEPDAHLHSDSQERLYTALKSLSDELGTKVILTTHSPQMVSRIMTHAENNIVWISDGTEHNIDKKDNKTIPFLMELGMMNFGSKIFDPNINTIILTEDTNTQFIEKLSKANGFDGASIISYHGTQNFRGALELSAILLHDRPDLNIYVHRDRDYRTDSEILFENLRFNKFKSERNILNMHQIFTKFNDAEHDFCQKDHLIEVFRNELNYNDISNIINDTIENLQNEFSMDLFNGRRQISETIYVERFKSSSLWKQAEMPATAPDPKSFLKNGQPFPFDLCYGKKLFKQLKEEFRKKLNKDPNDITNMMIQPTKNLKIVSWHKIGKPNG
jgi:predicted ATPase